MNAAVEAIAGPVGFTLVEEGDVAFSLRLCREVNRIYGDYQEGRIASTDPLLATLAMTVETLAVLSQTVIDGMPGMRISVAAAQTREMLAVLLDQDPIQNPVSRKARQKYRSIVAESADPVKSIDQARGELPKRRSGSGLLRLLGRRPKRRLAPEAGLEPAPERPVVLGTLFDSGRENKPGKAHFSAQNTFLRPERAGIQADRVKPCSTTPPAG